MTEKTQRMLEIEQAFRCDIEDLLKSLYSDHQETRSEVAQILGVNRSTVSRWLARFGITSEALSGRNFTPEWRQRLSEAHKGKQRGKDNPMYGKARSPRVSRGKAGFREDLGHYVRSSKEDCAVQAPVSQ